MAPPAKRGPGLMLPVPTPHVAAAQRCPGKPVLDGQDATSVEKCAWAPRGKLSSPPWQGRSISSVRSPGGCCCSDRAAVGEAGSHVLAPARACTCGAVPAGKRDGMARSSGSPLGRDPLSGECQG